MEEHIIVIPDVSTVNLNEVFCNWFLVCCNCNYRMLILILLTPL